MTSANTDPPNAVEIDNLSRRYGRTEAVRDLSLAVQPGRCYGLFGRNGAGKTTTIKCILGHLKPTSGGVRVFGLDPQKHEVDVKRHIGYVPEVVGFYPWMSANDMLNYAASFRPDQWNRALQQNLLERFQLDPKKKIRDMSKGMRAQLSLMCAIAAEPDLLLLDEPTSGLDPIVRREFIETVIGAYQEGAPDRRTVFVSTHLIGEFEGLIDEFAIIEEGRCVLSMEADAARTAYRKFHLRFDGAPPEISLPQLQLLKSNGRHVDFVTRAYSAELEDQLRGFAPEDMQVEPLSLEEIFVTFGRLSRGGTQ